jgi:hypothetical protein
MRRQRIAKAGFFVSSDDPEDVREECAILDFARYRAARFSEKEKRVFLVWFWNPANGYRCTKAKAVAGLVYWCIPCPSCAETGCVRCEDFGAIVDESKDPERSMDAL